MNLLRFEVGQPLPLPYTPPGFELCRASVNESFFDIVYWIRAAGAAELEPTWRKHKIHYGLFNAENIPFFIVDFPSGNPAKGWNFDIPINIKKVQDEKVEDWLNSEGNVINLYLCNCFDNTLLAMRMISIKTAVSEAIRDVLESQDEAYDTPADVDSKVITITDRYTTADMMKKIKMYAL